MNKKAKLSMGKIVERFFLWMWRFWMQYHLYGNVSISCILLYRLCRSKCIGSGNDYDGVKNF